MDLRLILVFCCISVFALSCSIAPDKTKSGTAVEEKAAPISSHGSPLKFNFFQEGRPEDNYYLLDSNDDKLCSSILEELNSSVDIPGGDRSNAAVLRYLLLKTRYSLEWTVFRSDDDGAMPIWIATTDINNDGVPEQLALFTDQLYGHYFQTISEVAQIDGANSETSIDWGATRSRGIVPPSSDQALKNWNEWKSKNGKWAYSFSFLDILSVDERQYVLAGGDFGGRDVVNDVTIVLEISPDRKIKTQCRYGANYLQHP